MEENAGASASASGPAASDQEPARKRPRSEGLKVKVRFEAHGRDPFEISIYQFWLTSEYFEAKLERWTSSGRPEEPIRFELPPDFDPELGALVFKKRLAAAEVDEEEDWDPVKWWRATDGEEEQLFAALFIFDLVLMHPYCLEVVETLHTFHIDCPYHLASVAKKYRADLWCGLQPIVVPAVSSRMELQEAMTKRMAQKLLKAFCKAPDCIGTRFLLERAFAKCQSKSELDAWTVGLLTKHIAWMDLTDLAPQVRVWMRHHLKILIRQRVSRTKLVVSVVRDMINTVDEEPLADFMAEVVHLLFIESRRSAFHAEQQAKTSKAIRLMVEVAWPDDAQAAKWGNKGRALRRALRSRISPKVFGIASISAQRSAMLTMQLHMSRFLHGNIHLVHAELREMLLPYLERLSSADRLFLAKVPFCPFALNHDDQNSSGKDSYSDSESGSASGSDSGSASGSNSDSASS